MADLINPNEEEFELEPVVIDESTIGQMVVINNDRLVAEGYVRELHDDNTVTVELKGSGRTRRVIKDHIVEVIGHSYLGRDIQL